ncbi:MAG: mechanosensitive ion channel family protein [Candidatus Anstonellales archaeon]
MLNFILQLFNLLPPLPGGSLTLAFLIFIISYFLFSFLFVIIFNYSKRISEKTKTTLDDMIIDVLQKASGYFTILLSAFISIAITYPSLEVLNFPVLNLFSVIFIIFFVFLANKLAVTILLWYGREIMPQTKTTIDDELFPLVRKIVSIAIYAIGAIIIFDRLGIEIGPLLAALGIGGLAVALALQETLSNFFAGIYILADKPVRLNDYIKVEGSPEYEGNVTEIGWRSTKILTPAQNLIILPNSKLAQATIINYSAPTSSSNIVMTFSASYDSDPDKVERILKKCVSDVAKTEPVISSTFEPIVRFDSLSEFALQFKVIFSVTNYQQRFKAIPKINKAVIAAFRKNRITIPYPITTVYIKNNKNL